MAVWSQRWFIVVPLVALILGHWSLLMHGEHQDGRCVLPLNLVFRGVVESGVGSRRMRHHFHEQQDPRRLFHLRNGLRFYCPVPHCMEADIPQRWSLQAGHLDLRRWLDLLLISVRES